MSIRAIAFTLLLSVVLAGSARAEEQPLPRWSLEEISAGKVAEGAEGWVDLGLGERRSGRPWSWIVLPVRHSFDPVFHFVTGEEQPVVLIHGDGVKLPHDRRRNLIKRLACRVRVEPVEPPAVAESEASAPRRLTMLEARPFIARLPDFDGKSYPPILRYVPHTAFREYENGKGIRADILFDIERSEQSRINPETNLPEFDYHTDFRVVLKHQGGAPLLVVALGIRNKTAAGEGRGLLVLAGRDGFRTDLFLEKRRKATVNAGRVTLESMMRSCTVMKVYCAEYPERLANGIRERLPVAKDFKFAMYELKDKTYRIDLVNHSRYAAGVTAALVDKLSPRRRVDACVALAPGQKVWKHYKPTFVLAVGDRPIKWQRPDLRALWVPTNPKNIPATERWGMYAHRTDGPLVTPRFFWARP